MRFFVSMFEANGSNPSFKPTATGKRASAAQLKRQLPRNAAVIRNSRPDRIGKH